MNHTTKRTWCRGAFLAFCVLPTLLLLVWIAARSVFISPAEEKAAWEQSLSSRLGMAVSIECLTHPHFAFTELGQVALADPETGEILARAAVLEVTEDNDGWQIEAVSPKIEAAHLGRLTQILHDRLLCQGSSILTPCDFFARELTVVDDANPCSLSNVQAALEATESGPQLSTSFQWPEATNEEQTVHCLLARHRGASSSATSLAVNTGKSALPCRLAANLWPPLEHLGKEAHFRGRIGFVFSPDISGEMQGTLSGIDLDALISEQFAHVLSGRAQVSLEKVSLAGGRLVSAVGTLEVSAGGKVSRSLLAAAKEYLLLKYDASEAGLEVISYRRLAIGFRIDEERLQLRGGADAASPGVLITNNTSPILEAPPRHAAPTAAIARVLLPDSRVQVPATAQTASLVRLLPTPGPVGTQTARRSHVPTRLSPGGSSAEVIRER